MPDPEYLVTLQKYNSNAANCRLANEVPNFFGGTLSVIKYDDQNRKDAEAYFFKSNKGSQIFLSVPELLMFTTAKKAKLAFYEYLVSVVGISGLVAISITFAIIGLLVHDPGAEIPTILTGSLSTILGFYFGTATKT